MQSDGKVWSKERHRVNNFTKNKARDNPHEIKTPAKELQIPQSHIDILAIIPHFKGKAYLK